MANWKRAAIHTFLSNSNFITNLGLILYLLCFWYAVLTTCKENSSFLETVSLWFPQNHFLGSNRKTKKAKPFFEIFFEIPFFESETKPPSRNFVPLLQHNSWFVSFNLSKIQCLKLSASSTQKTTRKTGNSGNYMRGKYPPSFSFCALFIPSSLMSRQNGLMMYGDNGLAGTSNKRPF